MDHDITPLLQEITFFWCFFTLFVFAFFAIKLFYYGDDEIKAKRSWIDQQPSIISTLGVLGTFAGITIGLMNFDTTDLDNSIPLMLQGLKTAFYTSLTGMFLSMIMNRIVSKAFDKIDCKEKNLTEKINSIIEIVGEILNEYQNTSSELKNISSLIVSSADKNDEMLERIKDEIESVGSSSGQLSEIKETIDQISEMLESINDKNTDATADEVAKLGAIMLTATESISSMDNATDRITVKLEDMKKKLETIQEKVTTIAGKKQ